MTFEEALAALRGAGAAEIWIQYSDLGRGKPLWQIEVPEKGRKKLGAAHFKLDEAVKYVCDELTIAKTRASNSSDFSPNP